MPRSNQRLFTTTTTRRASFALLLLALHHEHQHQSWSSGCCVNALSSIAVGSSTTRTITVTDVPERNRLLLDEAVTNDRTSLGNLIVPHVGIGTIAWSTDNGACVCFDPLKRGQKTTFSNRYWFVKTVGSLQHKELQSLVDTACENHIGFFDTAERYGSSLKTAVGLGWGETEQLTKRLLMQSSRKSNNSRSPAAQVATKFTPSRSLMPVRTRGNVSAWTKSICTNCTCPTLYNPFKDLAPSRKIPCIGKVWPSVTIEVWSKTLACPTTDRRFFPNVINCCRPKACHWRAIRSRIRSSADTMDHKKPWIIATTITYGCWPFFLWLWVY
jgi:hypothetical protein